MALTVLALNIPAGYGVGTSSDVHLLDAQKSFVLDGTLANQEQLVIEATNDPAGVSGWIGIVAWTNSNPGDITFGNVAYWLRVRRLPGSAISTPTASVSSTTNGTNTFFSIPVASSGPGAGVDISAGGDTFSVTIDGVLGTGEMVVIQGSNDNVSWNGLISLKSNYPGPSFLPTKYKFVRTVRTNLGGPAGSAVQIFLGTAATGSSSTTTSTAWQATVLANAQKVFGTAPFDYWTSGFVNTADWVANPAGNNNGSAPLYCDSTHTTLTPSCATLTPAISGAALMMGPPGLTYEVKNPRTDKWYVAAYFKNPNAIAVTDETDFVGFFNGSFYCIGILKSASATNYVMSLGAAPFVSTKAIDTVFHLHEFYFDGTTITYAIDGVVVATSAVLTNLPATAMGVTIYISSIPNTGTVIIDNFLVAMQQAT